MGTALPLRVIGMDFSLRSGVRCSLRLCTVCDICRDWYRKFASMEVTVTNVLQSIDRMHAPTTITFLVNGNGSAAGPRKRCPHYVLPSVFLSSARVFQVMIKGDILQYSSVHGHFFFDRRSCMHDMSRNLH